MFTIFITIYNFIYNQEYVLSHGNMQYYANYKRKSRIFCDEWQKVDDDIAAEMMEQAK